MRGPRNKILALAVGSACFLALSAFVVEPEVHSFTGHTLLAPAGGSTVARIELPTGGEIEYSFVASSPVWFKIRPVAAPRDIYSYPHPPALIEVMGTLVDDTFWAPTTTVYALEFWNPSDTSRAEVAFSVSHSTSLPTAPGLLLVILAMIVASPVVSGFVFIKRWQKPEISPGQRAINDLWERRRVHPSSAWIRH